MVGDIKDSVYIAYQKHDGIFEKNHIKYTWYMELSQVLTVRPIYHVHMTYDIYTVKTCDSSIYHLYVILFISNIPSCFWYAIYTESIISQTMSYISNSIQLIYYIILILYHIYVIYISYNIPSRISSFISHIT